MNTQEREINLLNKMVDTQAESIKIYQESIVPTNIVPSVLVIILFSI